MALSPSPSSTLLFQARCLITGGSGFVGSHIVRALAELHPDWTIVSLDLHPPEKNGIFSANLNFPNVTFTTADITVQSSIAQAVEESSPDVIIHTAGIVPPLAERWSRRWEERVFKVNVEGTKNVIKAVTEVALGEEGGKKMTDGKGPKTRALVYTSSCCAVIDNLKDDYRNVDERWPTSMRDSSIYGESKAHAEALILRANNPPTLSTCILRPSVLTGPGDYQLIPSIHACIAKHETPYILGPALNLWDVTDVRNVAHAHVLATENLLGFSSRGPEKALSAAGEVFFIQNNEPIPFRDFCLSIWREFGHFPPYEVRIPLWAAWAAGAVCEGLARVWWGKGAMTTLSRGSVGDACAMRYVSGEKARRVLGFENVVGLEESIRQSCVDLKRRLRITTKEQSEEEKAK